MAKGEKVHLFNESTFDGINVEHSMKNKMVSEFGLNGYNIITKLMEKLKNRKATLVAQEELLILEKEINLELQELIINKEEMLETLTKELPLVKVTIEEKNDDLSSAKTSIVGLDNAKEALKTNISCLKVHSQELQVQLDTLKTTTTSCFLMNSDASSSSSNTCKNCLKYHANCCMANHVKKGTHKVETKKIMKKSYCNDGLEKVGSKYKLLRNNDGKRALGYNLSKVNPSIEHKGWESPKFIEGTTLYDALGRIHSSNASTSKIREKVNDDLKGKMKSIVPIREEQATIYIANSYLSDYMLTWDHGKRVVKYVDAYTKRKVMKRSVWVPKSITNTQGPNSFWVPKCIA
jgi:hypothetical protein